MAFNVRKIDPIDLQPRKAVGVSLPFSGKAVFNSTFQTKDAIKTKEKLSELLSKIPKIDIFINTTALIEFCLFEMSTLSFAKKVFETIKE